MKITTEIKSMIHQPCNSDQTETNQNRVDEYPEPSELTMKGSLQYVSKSLLLLILWLNDKRSLENVSGFDEVSHYSLSECITSSIGYNITPQSLALGHFIDHTYGSTEPIDVLSQLGLCKPYDEIRRCKTSMAHYVLETSKQQNHQVRIPNVIIIKKPEDLCT